MSAPSSTPSTAAWHRADSRAIENLRAALPRDPDELERLYPRTAAELFSWGKSWLETCQNAFAGLDVDPDRVREVAALIPGAMRGLVSERQLGSYADLDMARRGLTNALAAYLEQYRVAGVLALTVEASDIRIREATPDDFADVAEMHYPVWRQSWTGILAAAFARPARSAETLGRRDLPANA